MFCYPCKDCPDRAVGCHGNCQKYLDAKAAHRIKFTSIKKAKQQQDSLDDYEIRRYEKWAKRHERRR